MMKFKRLLALETIYLQNTIPPACSIHQRPRINTIAPIQISAELKQWLLTTIRHYSPLFALFVLFAIRYSRLFAIRYSGFPDTHHSTFFVASLVFVKGTSCCIITKNFKNWNWAVRSFYGKILQVIGYMISAVICMSLRAWSLTPL